MTVKLIISELGDSYEPLDRSTASSHLAPLQHRVSSGSQQGNTSGSLFPRVPSSASPFCSKDQPAHVHSSATPWPTHKYYNHQHPPAGSGGRSPRTNGIHRRLPSLLLLPTTLLLIPVFYYYCYSSSAGGSPTGSGGSSSSSLLTGDGRMGWVAPPCTPASQPPRVTDIYVIHSYWHRDRKDMAPAICRWLSQQTDHYLSTVPCTLVPGFHAANATREQIRDLMARRIVAPETHARPPGLLTRVLHSLGLATPAKPLLDPDTESITNPSYVGTAASHLLAVNNWTMGLHDAGLVLAERAQQHLLILEDDAVLTREGLTQLDRTLAKLDRCYDVYALDSKANYCDSYLAARTLLTGGLFLTPGGTWEQGGRRRLAAEPVRPRFSYSRNTGSVISYKGALALLRGLPVTHEIDLWFRNMMTDGLLKIYVACPRIFPNAGLPTVV